MIASAGKVLITGATGFVGRNLRVVLEAAQRPVRLASRKPAEAHYRAPGEWVYLDAEQPHTLAPALQGCTVAYYLVHQMHGPGDFVAREKRAAEAFAQAATQAGLKRLVYLGGVAPQGPPSPHLRSRLQTGEILRRLFSSTVEIRAAMIIGAGSVSWRMVRDLAARLPAMVLPRWLGHHSWPVAADDVLAALLVAADLPDDQVGCYDLPGPERLEHREVLQRTAERFGRHPLMVRVPVLSPRLSSYWIRLVTDVDLKLTRELVKGLQSDLEPNQPLFWTRMPQRTPMTINEAITHALADELRHGPASQRTRQRLEAIAAGYLATHQVSSVSSYASSGAR